MTRDHDPSPFSETALDAGLRAAFGDSGGPSVARPPLHSLGETIGYAPRALRETPDEPSPLLRPLARGRRSMIGDRYQLVGEIARGGVGVVLKGRDVDLGRDIAIKVLRDDHAGNENLLRRFVEEAQIAGQLQHPGILPVYDVGLDSERKPFFTMKLVKGETLAAHLDQRRGPDDELTKFLGIFEQVCQTVSYAHAKGVIHRDLKPSNILVGAFGEVQVVDWGFAKVLAHGGRADDQLAERREDESVVETVRTSEGSHPSLVGSVMGTPAYMSPAQARGEVDRLDARSDVFSLGAMLCEILTGQPPYRGDRSAVLEQARIGDVRPVERRLVELECDPALIELTMACLATGAEGPRHAGEVVEPIAGYLESLRRRAHDSELAAARAEADAREARRARKSVMVVGTLLFTLASVVGAGSYLWQAQASEQRTRETNRVAQAIEEAATTLGGATEASVGVEEPWFKTRTAVTHLASLLESGEIEPETHARGTSLVERFRRADRDRALAVTMENVVILGATHLDTVSWARMEEQLRVAFLEYGIDIVKQDNAAIASAIEESSLASQLCDGFELWMATGMHLIELGEPIYDVDWLISKLEVLYLADRDPIATRVRQILYSAQPTRDDVSELIAAVDVSAVRPRTLAWIGSTCIRVQAIDLMDEIQRRALLEYPDDFMLNFDYAYSLRLLDQWEEAIRYYMRCLAIRPGSGGVWRALGTAYLAIDDSEQAIHALEQSIRRQPDHSLTYLDLAQAYEAADHRASALDACARGLRQNPDNAAIRAELERLKNLENDAKKTEGK